MAIEISIDGLARVHVCGANTVTYISSLSQLDENSASMLATTSKFGVQGQQSADLPEGLDNFSRLVSIVIRWIEAVDSNAPRLVEMCQG